MIDLKSVVAAPHSLGLEFLFLAGGMFAFARGLRGVDRKGAALVGWRRWAWVGGGLGLLLCGFALAIAARLG